MKVNNKTLILNCLMQGKTTTQIDVINQFNSISRGGYLISTKMQKNVSNHGMHARYEVKGISLKLLKSICILVLVIFVVSFGNYTHGHKAYHQNPLSIIGLNLLGCV